MNGLLEKTAEFLAAYKQNKLAVGVSGGRDSVCLLHAVLNCGAVQRDNIVVVHVNHKLRDAADSDEKFVRELCARYGVKFMSYTVDVKGDSAASGATIEQAARTLRYGVFAEIIKRGAADYVLSAHHALDNAETTLMHLFRGAGLDGLRGMKASGDMLGGRMLRPFIDVYPDELDEYVERHDLAFVTDETNFIDDADRNYIRLIVLPTIERRYRGAVRAVNELSAECVAACEALDGALDMNKISFCDGAVIIDDSALHTPLAARYVRRAAAYFSTVDLTRDMTERVVKLAQMRVGATVEINNGVVASHEYGCIALYIPRLKCDVELPIKVGANFIDGLAVDVNKSDASPLSVRGGAVDLDALTGATLRFRREGDMFTPFGGKRKKLKQYFIDKKIPKRLRDRIPLVCRGNDVLVVVGVEIADEVKQTKNTVNKAVVCPRWK